MSLDLWKPAKVFGPIKFLIAATFVASCTNPDQSQAVYEDVFLGSASTAGIYTAAGRALTSIVNDNLAINGFRLEDKLTAGSSANIDAVLNGELQFGLAQADDQFNAINGAGKWEAKGPQSDLRAVFSIYTEAVTLVAGADTDIKSVNDLQGKTVDIGLPGSGTRENAITALTAAGLDWQTDIKAVEGSLDDRLAQFMSNDLDAFFFTIGHPNKETNFATYSERGARLIALANIQSIVEAQPFYSEVYLPKELYRRSANEVGVESFGVRATLVTSANVPDDVVYAVTKAVFERDEKYAAIYPELSALVDGRFLDGLTAPIHPGALRYFQEAGIDIPAPLSEAAR